MGRKHNNDTYKKPNKIKIKNESKVNKKSNFVWIISIIIWTFVFSIFLNYISSSLLKNVNIFISFVILLLIVFLGITFDIIGTAVTAASEIPFRSMASKKIIGSSYAIKLIRNAEKVSNFCNDVIGDIAGIISGATSASIILELTRIYNRIDTVFVGAILTSLVAAVTVGGKALGKSISISQSNNIVYRVGVFIHYIFRILNFFKIKKKRKKCFKGMKK